jgi:CBS domain containing-hemolysin-like protein
MKVSGRIPNIHDQISVEGLTMIVKSVRGRRLEKVRILINK